MGIDYYGVLEISRSVSTEDIRRAYARVAVREHPERTRSCDGTKPGLLAQIWFRLAGEAYEVLSQPLLRAAFDQFGEEGLKNGVPSRDPQLFLQPWAYHGNPLKTYRDFFGTESASAPALLGWQQKFRRPDGAEGPWFREKPLEIPLPLTLEKVSEGGPAEVSFQRRELRDGVVEIHEHILQVTLQPGVVSGTRFLLPRQGHQAPNSVPGDVVLVTEDVPHAFFNRELSDLVATFRVSLEEALLGCAVSLTALDRRTIRIRVTDVILPHYELRVTGEGLPRCEAPCPEVEDPCRTCYVEKTTLFSEDLGFCKRRTIVLPETPETHHAQPERVAQLEGPNEESPTPPCEERDLCGGCDIVLPAYSDSQQTAQGIVKKPTLTCDSDELCEGLKLSETSETQVEGVSHQEDHCEEKPKLHCEGCTIVLPATPETRPEQMEQQEWPDVERPTLCCEDREPCEQGSIPETLETHSEQVAEEDSSLGAEEGRGDLVLRFVVEWPPCVPAIQRDALFLGLRDLTPNVPQGRAFISPLPAIDN